MDSKNLLHMHHTQLLLTPMDTKTLRTQTTQPMAIRHKLILLTLQLSKWDHIRHQVLLLIGLTLHFRLQALMGPLQVIQALITMLLLIIRRLEDTRAAAMITRLTCGMTTGIINIPTIRQILLALIIPILQLSHNSSISHTISNGKMITVKMLLMLVVLLGRRICLSPLFPLLIVLSQVSAVDIHAIQLQAASHLHLALHLGDLVPLHLKFILYNYRYEICLNIALNEGRLVNLAASGHTIFTSGLGEWFSDPDHVSDGPLVEWGILPNKKIPSNQTLLLFCLNLFFPPHDYMLVCQKFHG